MTVSVATFGAGVNGTAMLIEAVRRGIRPDVIQFSNTKAEKSATMRHVEFFSAWLVDRGFPPITEVTNKTTTLEKDCLVRHALPSVAYGFKTCSMRFKREPQDNWLKSYQPAIDAWARGERVEKWIGYDYGEPGRIKDFADDKFILRYPLFEWQLTRDDCAEICLATIGYIPPKSACFFCPNSKKAEIKELARAEPCLADRAIVMEQNANLITIKGLGRTFSWESFINADKAQDKLFADLEYDMPCECYDG